MPDALAGLRCLLTKRRRHKRRFKNASKSRYRQLIPLRDRGDTLRIVVLEITLCVISTVHDSFDRHFCCYSMDTVSARLGLSTENWSNIDIYVDRYRTALS